MLLLELPAIEYPAQRRTFQLLEPLEPSISEVLVTLTREDWPGSNLLPLIEIGLESSTDGALWSYAGSEWFVGSEWKDADGDTVDETLYTHSLPGVGDEGRLIRVFIQNMQPLTTAIRVEAA